MTTLWQDLRYAVRMLAKSPGFTTVAVLTLALGIGANTALFSIVHSVLLSPLPFPEPGQIMLLETIWRPDMESSSCSGPDYLDWAERNTTFQGLSAFEGCRWNLTGAGEPLALRGFQVTTDFFDVLDPPMVLGRGFRPEESQAGNHRVAVLSHRLWRDRFGSDRSILDKTIVLDGAPHTVVGVVAATMGFIEEMAQVYVPLERLVVERERRNHHFTVLGRLKPQASLSQAQAEMDGIALQLERECPESNSRKGVHMEPLHQVLVSHVRTAFLILYGAVTLLLLVACMNVSNLLVAKASLRHRELALRRALGAGQFRILRQLLTESVPLGLAGGALALLLSFGGLRIVAMIAPSIQKTGGTVPGFDEIQMSVPVLGFTLVVSLAAAILFGMVPAWQGARFRISGTLQEGGRTQSRGPSRHRAQSVLAVSQIALALVLLTGAGLLVKTSQRLEQADPGFDAKGVLALHVVRAENPANRSVQDRAAFFENLTERLAALAGVQAAGGIDIRPLNGQNSSSIFHLPGRDMEPEAEGRYVTTGYFDCLRIPLLKGRLFTPADDGNSQQVVVVNAEFVHRYFPDHDPIGQLIEDGGVPKTIVGVVGNVKLKSLRSDACPPFIYKPVRQTCDCEMTLFLRTNGDPTRWADAARRVIWEADPSQPILYTKTLMQLVRDSVSVEHFCTVLLGAMAGVALIMALTGLYGVMAFAANERRNEIGIRMALGADGRDIVLLIGRRALRLTLTGLALGLLGAFAASRCLYGLVYGVSVYDPVTFMLMPALLLGVALLASYVPVRRAAKVDPMVALRCE